jgi:hypothetical protein
MGKSNLRRTDPHGYFPLSQQNGDSGIEPGSNLRRTVPPTTTSSLLVQIEAIKSQQRELEGSFEATLLTSLYSWGEDIVLTHQDKPELIEQAAKFLGESPRKVSIHCALCDGNFFQGIFVNGHLRHGRAAKEALKIIDWSELIQAMTESQDVLSLNLEEL